MSRLSLPLPSWVLVLGALALLACGDDKDTTPSSTVSSLKGVPCDSDAQCAALHTQSCQQARCGEAGVCEIASVTDGTPCSTGALCVEGQTCLSGTCGGGTPPEADCGDRVCGRDDCGNSCGHCDDGYECTDAGLCEEIIDPCMGLTFQGCCTADGRALWCEDGALAEKECASCGWRDDVDYYFCTGGDEAPAPSASLPYFCPGEACDSPDPCNKRECGFQCGQSCGECGPGERCTGEGKCAPDLCGDLTFTGCCVGTLSYYCDADIVKVLDCGTSNPAACGWNTGEGFYDCAFEGADPTGSFAYDCADYNFTMPK